MPVTQETYGRLLSEALPAVIESAAQYEANSERLSRLLRKGRSRSMDETKFMKLLAVLVRDYDERNGLPPARMAPKEAMRYVLDHAGKTPSDLLPIFGQRSHVNEALNGKRKISAEQARKLSKMFGVNPGIFI